MISLLGIIPLLLIAYIMVKIFRPKPDIFIPPHLPDEGFRIPLLGSYLSNRSMQKISTFFTYAHNELYPSLKIFNDHMDYVCLFKKTRHFEQIEKIDVVSFWIYKHIVFYFKNENQTFMANLNSKHNLAELLKFLDSKNTFLTDSAKNFIR